MLRNTGSLIDIGTSVDTIVIIGGVITGSGEMGKQADMTRTRAISILECMATDMVGALASLSETNPLADVLSQRIEAINVAQNALRKATEESRIEHGY